MSLALLLKIYIDSNMPFPPVIDIEVDKNSKFTYISKILIYKVGSYKTKTQNMLVTLASHSHH